MLAEPPVERRIFGVLPSHPQSPPHILSKPKPHDKKSNCGFSSLWWAIICACILSASLYTLANTHSNMISALSNLNKQDTHLEPSYLCYSKESKSQPGYHPFAVHFGDWVPLYDSTCTPSQIVKNPSEMMNVTVKDARFNTSLSFDDLLHFNWKQSNAFTNLDFKDYFIDGYMSVSSSPTQRATHSTPP